MANGILGSGGIFSEEVCLGGRLYSSESLADATEEQLVERKNSMKYSITASFMGPFVGATLGGHRTKGSEEASSVRVSSATRGVSVEAQGGDSLLLWESEISSDVQFRSC